MSYIGAKELKASDIRRFDATGSTSATHTLTWTAPTEQSLIVTINGVKQQEDAYSVSGTTLTLTSALVSTDKLEVIGINDIGTTITPAQNSVTADTIADGAVTSAKILDGTILNADVNASAAIALSKLATDPSNASNLATGTVPTARLGSGTASSSTILYGDSSWAAAPSSGLNSVQTFTSSGTWTRPSGITKVIMEVQGGGGGGNSSTVTANCHCGGGGGYAKKFLDVSSISTSTITVGAAGAGSANSAGAASAGGNSSWADGTNTITGSGGPAASQNSSASAFRGGDGGTATGGDINIQGGSRDDYHAESPGPGESVLGTRGYKGSITYSHHASVAQLTAKGYGAGGGFVYADSESGSGSPGIVIVWEYK